MGRPPSPSLPDAYDPQGLAVAVLDPLDALQLGVHDEGPALAGGEDGGVLRGHPVGGQALVLPGGHVGVVHQHGQGVEVSGHGDGDLRRGGKDNVTGLLFAYKA